MKKTVKLLLAGLLLTGVLLLTACNSADHYVQLGDYKSISLTPEEADYSDKEFEDSVLMDQYAMSETTQITDRPAQEGDTVKVLYSLSVDGEVIDGRGEKYVLTIGEGACPFEDDLIGLYPGDSITVTKTIEDEELKDYLGKEGEYHAELTDILQIDVPEADEAFAKEMGYDSLEEYLEAKSAELLAQKEEELLEQQYEALLNQVIAISHFRDYPEDLITQKQEEIKNTYKAEAATYGVDYESYTSLMLGVDTSQIEDALYLAAVHQVEQQLVVNAIADKENLTISDEEYEQGVQEVLEEAGLSSREELKEKSGQDFEEIYDEETFRQELLRKKVCKFLYDNATAAK